MPPEPNTVAVVIPALNEAATIRDVVQAVLAECAQVIVIDDGSSDGTAERIADLPVTVLRHDTPRGKGQALRAGFDEALRRGCDGVVTMDADGQHDARDIPRLLAAARAYPDHLVIGARLRGRERQPVARRRANAVADWGISWGCGVPVADTQSGQRYYPRRVLARMALAADDFVFEAAILIVAARECGVGIVSVPIAVRYPEGGASHFRPIRDVTRITCYTIAQVVRYGHVIASYRRSHGRKPLLFDA